MRFLRIRGRTSYNRLHEVLLDEDLPHKLRLKLPNHDVSTVAYLGWDGLKNGDLLRSAEAEGFQVLVTGDKNLSYQQNMKKRRIGLVVLSAQDWPTINKNFAIIRVAVDRATPGSFQVVRCNGVRES